MDPLYKLLPNGFRICPYNHSHIILGVRFIGHLLKCSKSSGKKHSVCPWNAQHHIVEPNDFGAHVIDCDNRVLVENMLRGIKSQQDIQNQMASSIPDVQTHITQPKDYWSSDDDNSEKVEGDGSRSSPGGHAGSSRTLTNAVERSGSQTGSNGGRVNGEESGYRLPRSQPAVVRSGTPSGYGWSSDEEPTNGKVPKACSGVQKAVPASQTGYGWSSDEEEPEIVDATERRGGSSSLHGAGGMVKESELFRSALPFVAYGAVAESTLQSPQHSTHWPTKANGFPAEGQKPMPTGANGFSAEGQKTTPARVTGPSDAERKRTTEEELGYLIDAFATTSFANSLNGVALLETLVQGLSEEVLQQEK